VWAPYWYDSVHASTGFAAYRPPAKPLPARLEPLAERCRPYFERLHQYRIPADRAKGGAAPSGLRSEERATKEDGA
jgi:hypothetical protein